MRRAILSLCASTMVLAVGCRKQEPAQPAAKPAPAALGQVGADQSDPVAALAGTPSAAEAPPPELGIPYDVFVQAQVLRQCAEKFHEEPGYAETSAVNHVLGKQYPISLDRVFDKPAPDKPAPDKPRTKPGAKPTPAPAVKPEPQAPDTPDQLVARNKLRFAVNLAAAHTATQRKIADQLEHCLYARELGLVTQAYVDRYVNTFVEVACLQRKFTDAEGKVDAMGHATAANEVFQRYAINAGELSRLGMVFARFQSVQAQVHLAKAKSCPDPRVAEEVARTTGAWSGELKGDRNGSLQLQGSSGKVKGAVQWQGATVKWADGAAETQAIPVEGQISGDRLALFGEINGDWIRLEGKGSGGSFAGTWQSQRASMDKFKGTFSAEKVPELPSAATPTHP